MLGVQLVERDRRTVRLTAVGEEVVARARGVLAAAIDLAEAARSASEPLSGPLRFGTIPTIAPSCCRRYCRRCGAPTRASSCTCGKTSRNGSRAVCARAASMSRSSRCPTNGRPHVQELFKDEFWYVARETTPLHAPSKLPSVSSDPVKSCCWRKAIACAITPLPPVARGAALGVSSGGDQPLHPAADGRRRDGSDAAAGRSR